MPYVIAFHHKGPAFCVNKSLDYLLKKKKKYAYLQSLHMLLTLIPTEGS